MDHKEVAGGNLHLRLSHFCSPCCSIGCVCQAARCTHELQRCCQSARLCTRGNGALLTSLKIQRQTDAARAFEVSCSHPGRALILSQSLCVAMEDRSSSAGCQDFPFSHALNRPLRCQKHAFTINAQRSADTECPAAATLQRYVTRLGQALVWHMGSSRATAISHLCS